MSIKSNKGFTLLEALIGFLILSIGMLGIASLQAISLKAGKTSVYNSIAIMKVEEIFESMRSNPSVLVIYTGAGNSTACLNTTNCDATTLADYDVFLWKQSLQVGLPASVTSNVVLTPATPPSKLAAVSVTIGWAERNKDGTGSVNKTYVANSHICTGVPC